MHLSRSQLGPLSRSMVRALVDAGDIEVSDAKEVERDLESVLSSYLTQVEQVVSRARDLVQQRGLPPGEFGRIKRLAAEQAGIKIDDEALDYVLGQLVEMLMSSQYVDEVFAEDHVLKRRMREFIRVDEEAEKEIEREVRDKLKHVQEGSRMWEIEYQRMKADIKRRKGM